MDSRSLVTITSWSLAFSSSLMPRLPTANDNHFGHELFSIRLVVSHRGPTCDSNSSLSIVGSLRSVFNCWLQLLATKHPPAGGDSELLKVRVRLQAADGREPRGDGEEVTGCDTFPATAAPLTHNSEIINEKHQSAAAL